MLACCFFKWWLIDTCGRSYRSRGSRHSKNGFIRDGYCRHFLPCPFLSQTHLLSFLTMPILWFPVSFFQVNILMVLVSAFFMAATIQCRLWPVISSAVKEVVDWRRDDSGGPAIDEEGRCITSNRDIRLGNRFCWTRLERVEIWAFSTLIVVLKAHYGSIQVKIVVHGTKTWPMAKDANSAQLNLPFK